MMHLTFSYTFVITLLDYVVKESHHKISS